MYPDKAVKTNTIQSNPKRQDIQFLRFVSILLVVLFHIDHPAMPSGYIGVDLFFVISGFLMAPMLTSFDRKSIGQFYARRLRRIVPAYITVLIVVLILAPFVFQPVEYRELLGNVPYFIVLSPNIAYWMDVGYFANDQFRPLLHFWSLGVEFHFYAVFPLLFLLYKRAFRVFLLLALLTLIGCYIVQHVNAKSAFFLMPLRIWEFSIGILAYRYQLSTARRLQGTVGLTVQIGCVLGMLLLAGLSIPPKQFPVPAALIASILAMVFLITPASWNGRVLQSAPFRAACFGGELSYSIYLVHYPVIFLMFYSPLEGGDPVYTDTYRILAAIVITLIASYLLYRFVETPLRKKTVFSSGKVKRHMAVVVALPTVACVWVLAVHALSAEHRDPMVRAANYAVTDKGSFRCNLKQTTSSLDYASCKLTESDTVDTKVLLVGNSHANALKPILETLAIDSNVALYMMKANCPLGAAGPCSHDQLVKEIERREIDAVVVHSSPNEIRPEAIAQFASSATRLGVSVHHIDPVPVYENSVPAMVINERSNINTLSNGGYSANLMRADLSNHLDGVEHQLDSLPAGLWFRYSLADHLCQPECRIADNDGYLMYHDSHHLSRKGAEFVKPPLRQLFTDILKKQT